MIIDKDHPKADSTVVRRVKDGTIVPFVVRVNLNEGWFERLKYDQKLHVADAGDGEPQVVRKHLGSKYVVDTEVPPIIKVRDKKTGKMRIFRRADLVPTEQPKTAEAPCVGCQEENKHPPFIKVSGKIYQREDLVGK